jgi:hypothetical protein
VVSRVNGVADNVGTLEQVCFEVVQREGHTGNVSRRWHRFCGDWQQQRIKIHSSLVEYMSVI